MSEEELADEVVRGVDELQGEVDSLQSAVRLTDLRERCASVGSLVDGLPPRITVLRTRGYPFADEQAQKASALQQQWAVLGPQVLDQIARQASSLEWDLRRAEEQLRDLRARAGNVEEAQSLLIQTREALAALQSKVEAATESTQSMFEPVEAEAQAAIKQLDLVEWTFQQLAEASFHLQDGESAVMAVKAKWDVDGKDDPEGVLYLTNRRVLFEQKQEVAAKKVLFITTKKEKVQRLLLDTPVSKLAKAEPMKKGLMGHEDHLEVSFQPGVNPALAHFHIFGQDCRAWPDLFARARSL